MTFIDTAATRPSLTAAAPRRPGLAPAVAALCLGAAAMGISPIFVRLASADVGPFASAFWRVGLALPVLYAWMRIAEARTPPSAATRPGARAFTLPVLLAGLAFSGDLFFWHLAILNTTVANATFFATTAPLFVVLTAWLILRRRIATGTLIGLALCLAGGAALIGQSLQVDPARLRGDLYGVGTALFFGLYFLAIERAREDGGGAARVTFQASLVTAAVLLVVALALEPHVLPRTVEGLLALVAMAWISHAGGQGLLSVALGRLPAVFSSLVIFLEAIVAAIFGWMILGETLSLIQIAGGALILVGIWAARPRAEKRESTP